jgi:hypothetical protein
VLRLAGALDLERWRQAQASRLERFSQCQRVLEQGDWPWELVDVEPLLDGRSIVIQYLGPHHLDATPWRARFRVECDFDVMLEPVGPDVDVDEIDESSDLGAGGGGCGNGGCGAGGCGTKAGAAPDLQQPGARDARGCSSKAHAGCSSCGISQMLAARGRANASTPLPEPQTSTV